MASAANACRHILLTGPPGVGKTTMVHKVCESLSKSGITTQGFYTEEVREGRQRVGFDVVTLDGNRGPLARVSEQGGSSRSYTVGKYNVQLMSFEQTALPTLKQKPNEKVCVFVIDEIGKMELFSQSFVLSVKEILNNPKTTVLATIPIPKGRPIPFVEEVRSRKDVQIFTISRENRDTILDSIISALKDSVRKFGTLSILLYKFV